jgi:thiamine biosynthesis lipoprotein
MYRATFPALGTTAVLLVTEASALARAERLLRADLDALDLACSRFRADSEVRRLPAGRPARVSPLLREALHAALRTAEATGGLVDPTVGGAVARLGYDRDFAEVPADGPEAPAGTPAPGWWRVRLAGDRVVVPRGVSLDLGASAKAFAADRAAGRIAEACGCGVLVSLGGDLAVAGRSPDGGWLVSVGDDHRRDDPGDQVVAVSSGGLATSTVACRAWRRGGRTLHHIVDPRTGEVPEPVWRTVSVAGASCLAANAASTAAIVLGAGATRWLLARRLPARLVGVDGRVSVVAGWPEPDSVAGSPESVAGWPEPESAAVR